MKHQVTEILARSQIVQANPGFEAAEYIAENKKVVGINWFPVVAWRIEYQEADDYWLPKPITVPPLSHVAENASVLRDWKGRMWDCDGPIDSEERVCAVLEEEFNL